MQYSDFMRHITLLPAMIFVAMLAFSVRLVDVYSGFQNLDGGVAFAEEIVEAPSGEGLQIVDEPKILSENEGDKEPAESVSDKADVSKESKESDEDLMSKWRDATDEDFGFRAIKIEHEEALEERRLELVAKENELRAREALLKAAEQEMDQKFIELQQIRKQIEELLEKQKVEEKTQIDSLVKIYEGMKAKDAAAIFNTLDMEILVEVMRNMSERKASPILAAMTPERARSVTMRLAQDKKLPELPSRN